MAKEADRNSKLAHQVFSLRDFREQLKFKSVIECLTSK